MAIACYVYIIYCILFSTLFLYLYEFQSIYVISFLYIFFFFFFTFSCCFIRPQWRDKTISKYNLLRHACRGVHSQQHHILASRQIVMFSAPTDCCITHLNYFCYSRWQDLITTHGMAIFDHRAWNASISIHDTGCQYFITVRKMSIFHRSTEDVNIPSQYTRCQYSITG